MSREARDRVWTYSQQRNSKLVLMLALAEWASPDGFCYPSWDTLADRLRLSKDRTAALVGEVEKTGELYVKGGHHPAFLITLNLSAEQIFTVLRRDFGMKKPDAQRVALEVWSQYNGENLETQGFSQKSANPRTSRKQNSLNPRSKVPESEELSPQFRGVELPESEEFHIEPSKGTVNEPSENQEREDAHKARTRRQPPSRDGSTPTESISGNTPEQRQLLEAVLRATGQETNWQMGQVSHRFKREVAQLTARLEREGYGAEDVRGYVDALPLFLRRDPGTVTPPTPGQMLYNFEQVLAAGRNARNGAQHNGTSRSDSGPRVAPAQQNARISEQQRLHDERQQLRQRAAAVIGDVH